MDLFLRTKKEWIHKIWLVAFWNRANQFEKENDIDLLTRSQGKICQATSEEESKSIESYNNILLVVSTDGANKVCEGNIFSAI